MIGVLETAPYVAGALSAGGIGAYASRKRELIRRWWTWALTAPVVGGTLFLGRPGAIVLASALAVVATVEYARLAKLPALDRAVMAAGLVATIVTTQPRVWIVAAIAVAVTPVLAGDAEDGARRSAYSLLGFVWLSALAGFVSLGHASLPIFFAVSIADVAAWCAGRAVKGRKLSALSPNKTLAGLVGGALAGVLTLALLGALTPVLIIAVVVAAPIGDLFESMLKRGANVKDAGSWLPGFGGLLDRIDSVLFAFAIAMVLS
jgi:phosphatidate cytidylyltransferase